MQGQPPAAIPGESREAAGSGGPADALQVETRWDGIGTVSPCLSRRLL